MTDLPTRAMFMECSRPEWPVAAARLVAEYGWEICYWVGSRKDEVLIREMFPGVVHQSSREARTMKAPAALEDMALAPLDETLIKRMAHHQTVVEKMLERFDLLNHFLFQDKVQHYHRLLMYWSAVLDRFQPDVVVFCVAPHAVYDYIVYGLCEIRGIRTIMFERTTFPGLITIMEKFEEGPKDLRSAYEEKLAGEGPEQVVLSPAIEARLAEIRGDFADGMAPHMRYVVEQNKQKRHFARFVDGGEERTGMIASLGEGLSRALSRIWQLIDILVISGPEPWYQVKKGRKLGDEGMSRREYLSYRLAARRAKKQLRDTYDRLSRHPDLSKPYVYVALQAEPERQTTPCGGVFMHQYLLVDMLAKLVPDGWHVYVKEHLVGLNPHFHSERSRTPSFYEFIADIPKVTLVPLAVTSFDLIDTARAVATVSGSSGWEAVVRGKPVLLFGYAWYRDCEGVFQVRSEENLRAALASVEAGHSVNSQNLRLFVQALEEVATPGFIDGVYEQITGISTEENGTALADAMGTLCRDDSTTEERSAASAGI